MNFLTVESPSDVLSTSLFLVHISILILENTVMHSCMRIRLMMDVVHRTSVLVYSTFIIDGVSSGVAPETSWMLVSTLLWKTPSGNSTLLVPSISNPPWSNVFSLCT